MITQAISYLCSLPCSTDKKNTSKNQLKAIKCFKICECEYKVSVSICLLLLSSIPLIFFNYYFRMYSFLLNHILYFLFYCFCTCHSMWGKWSIAWKIKREGKKLKTDGETLSVWYDKGKILARRHNNDASITKNVFIWCSTWHEKSDVVQCEFTVNKIMKLGKRNVISVQNTFFSIKIHTSVYYKRIHSDIRFCLNTVWR